MNLPYHPDAALELQKAISSYLEVDADLADELIGAVLDAETDIENGPMRYPLAEDAPIRMNVRYRVLRKFQFRIIYVLDSEGILIVAFAHLHQRPGYWRERLKS